MGGQAVFKYLPAGSKGGTVSYTMGGSGVKGSGKGAFAMAALDDGRVRIKQTTTGCVDGIPNSCRTTTEVITLTSKSKKK